MPSGHITLVRQGESRETKAIANITLGHGGILHGGKDLPAIVLGRAGHQASCVPSVKGVVGPGLARDVGEAANGGTRGDASGVGLGEAQSARGSDVDLLTAGDLDILV